jgi:hypothetical protein
MKRMHVYHMQIVIIIKSKLTKKEKTYSQGRRVMILVWVIGVSSQLVSLKYTQSNLFLASNKKLHVNIYIKLFNLLIETFNKN